MVDPLVCPRGHHSVVVGARRFHCQTCNRKNLDPRNWDRSELVNLTDA